MKAELGTIIHATLREEDLIPAFLDTLKTLDTEHKYEKLIEEAAGWETMNEEERSYLLNEQLFDALNDFAPENAYFGSHPGDGSDFGYWKSEDDE